MPAKQLTQAGLNRVIWKLLATQKGGKFTITNRELETFRSDAVIKIDYDPALDSFTLSLKKIPNAVESPNIILPQRMNLN